VSAGRLFVLDRAAWSRIDLGGGALDLLDVSAAATRSWSFVWPGRVAIQARAEGVSWTHGDDAHELRPGAVLLAAPLAAQLRIRASSGAAFRVVFEHLASGARRPHGRGGWPHAGLTLATDVHPGELLRAAIASASAAPASVGGADGPAARARDYIEKNVDEDFDLAHLSAQVGVAPCHLCRTFQRTIGLSPYRFRAHLRVARARERLAEGLDCGAVAHAVGFYDQSHLTRVFKAVTGTTPGAYARACRAPAAAWRDMPAA
jgi:AraC-like DNA-binding protein